MELLQHLRPDGLQATLQLPTATDLSFHNDPSRWAIHRQGNQIPLLVIEHFHLLLTGSWLRLIGLFLFLLFAIMVLWHVESQGFLNEGSDPSLSIGNLES